MKTTTYAIILKDKDEAERLENTVHASLDELKGVLANDGVEVTEILPMSDLMEAWNRTERDHHVGMNRYLYDNSFTYVNIIE